MWGESTGDLWFPLTKAVTRSFDIFFDLRLKIFGGREIGGIFEDPVARSRYLKHVRQSRSAVYPHQYRGHIIIIWLLYFSEYFIIRSTFAIDLLILWGRENATTILQTFRWMKVAVFEEMDWCRTSDGPLPQTKMAQFGGLNELRQQIIISDNCYNSIPQFSIGTWLMLIHVSEMKFNTVRGYKRHSQVHFCNRK